MSFRHFHPPKDCWACRNTLFQDLCAHQERHLLGFQLLDAALKGVWAKTWPSVKSLILL